MTETPFTELNKLDAQHDSLMVEIRKLAFALSSYHATFVNALRTNQRLKIRMRDAYSISLNRVKPKAPPIH